MTNKIRTIHYGLGSIGSGIARLVAQRASLEIVGGIDVDEQKVGKDMGKVIGLGQTLGLRVSSNSAAVFSQTEADVVLHSTGSYVEQVRPQLIEIIEAGLNVVSTCEELAYPQAQYPALAEELDTLARKHAVTLLGTGVNPGFAQDTIAIAASGVCQDVKHITVTRTVEAGERRLPLQKKVGAGLTVAEFEEKARKREIRHVGLEESATMVAHALGWQLDKVEETMEPVIAEKPLKTQFVEVKEGQVSGIHQVARGFKDDQELIVLHLYMHIGAENPGDSVVIEGTPDIELTIKGIHGDLATAAMAVNAVPKVVNAPPGLMTMKDLPLVCPWLGD
ncbi:MAG: dihydrodipicolinate reductase [Anaerolineales bacterium]|nr:MAG: dihydrodipicolinate reductase [Anaerolineales bacterium]